jgi:hypothetical protein
MRGAGFDSATNRRFRYRRWVSRRLAAGGAEQHEAILLKYELSEAALARPGKLLDRFDASVLFGNNGRTAQRSATPQLDALAAEPSRQFDESIEECHSSRETLLDVWSRKSVPVRPQKRRARIGRS